MNCSLEGKFINNINKYKLTNRRNFSTSNKNPTSVRSAPIPVLILNSLKDENYILSFRKILKNKGGIYSFINTINGNQYIGSAKDLYIRLNEHLKNKKSNAALQKGIEKYGLDNFNFWVYEYFTYETKIISSKALTDLETNYISKFNIKNLYNFKTIATSMLGYKHTEEAILKMKKHYENKENHPMYGKNHAEESLSLISKPGILNPMYGKIHNESTKKIMSEKKNKYALGVGIFDLEGNLIEIFKNNVELAEFLNISKVTVGKYLNNNLVYNKIYRFKPIQD